MILAGFIVLLIMNLFPAFIGWIFIKNSESDELSLKKAGKMAIYRTIIIEVISLAVYFFIPDSKKYIMLIFLGIFMLINVTLIRMRK